MGSWPVLFVVIPQRGAPFLAGSSCSISTRQVKERAHTNTWAGEGRAGPGRLSLRAGREWQGFVRGGAPSFVHSKQLLEPDAQEQDESPGHLWSHSWERRPRGHTDSVPGDPVCGQTWQGSFPPISGPPRASAQAPPPSLSPAAPLGTAGWRTPRREPLGSTQREPVCGRSGGARGPGQAFSTRTAPHARGHSTVPGDRRGCHNSGRATGIKWVEAGDAAEHPAARTAPLNTESSGHAATTVAPCGAFFDIFSNGPPPPVKL